MKNFVLMMTIVFTGFSCPNSIIFDGSERYRIKGKVTDDKGNPLKNIDVSFEVLGSQSIYNGLIQKGVTDNNGRFDMIFSKNNGHKYYLKLNYIPEYWDEDTHNYNVQYSEKYLFFDSERFGDYEFDLTSYCSLIPGVVLSFLCASTNDNTYTIHFETEQDIYLDGKTGYYFRREIRSSKYINSRVLVPQNSKVKLIIYSRNTSFVDSILVTDIPYNYILK